MKQLDLLVPPSEEAEKAYHEALKHGVRFVFGVYAEYPSHESIKHSKGELQLEVDMDQMNLKDCATYEAVKDKRKQIIDCLNVHTYDIYKILLINLVDDYNLARACDSE